MKWIVHLIAILLLAGCAAAEAGDAFPHDEAGMCAYVNIGESINLEDAIWAYYQIEELSETHTIGRISIGNGGGGSVDIRVYADVDGWIVAYLLRSHQTAEMIQWSGINVSNPVFGNTNTTLADAISRMCTAIDVNYTDVNGNIQYYDFEYPDADKMLIFTNTRTSIGNDYIIVLIPDTYTVYEAIFSLTGLDTQTRLYIDGVHIATTPDCWYCTGRTRVCGGYGTRLTIGDPHDIQFYGQPYDDLSGVANILIYS
jgi:hypothetical protein